jgi:hypothetical protein
MMAPIEVDMKRTSYQPRRGDDDPPLERPAQVDPEAPTAVEIPIRRPAAGTEPPSLSELTTAVFERVDSTGAEDDDGIVIVFADDDSDTAVDVVTELSDEDTEAVTDVDECRDHEIELDTMLVVTDDDDAAGRG